jgi:hypothetical protein
MNEFEELQNLWQNQNEEKALPSQSGIISQNTDNELIKTQTVIKKNRNSKLAATTLVVLSMLVLGFDFFDIGLIYSTEKSLNYLIMGILSGSVYLIWQNNLFTRQYIYKTNREFLGKKINELKFQKEYISYFLFFSELSLLVGINWQWWSDFSFLIAWKRIFVHISISMVVYVSFEVLKSLFVDAFEKETEALLNDLIAIKKNLEEDESLSNEKG